MSAICSPRYGRLSKMFLDVNGEHLRSLMRHIQARFEEYSTKLNGELPLDGPPKSVMEIATSILPQDDSSLRWSEPNGGITEDPATTILATRRLQIPRQKADHSLGRPRCRMD